ncbi:iron chaperone [Microcella sp.]|uniref:iron chaperone n=1 Tax=Microcella sp. TaxID=1913979 RepID=UPI003F70B067
MSEIDDYIAAAPEAARERLLAVRETLLRCVPGGTEAFRYGMPAVMVGARHGLHYANWTKHLALYPIYRGDDAFEAAVGPYRAKTDSVHFPHTQPLPLEVVELIATALAARRTSEE